MALMTASRAPRNTLTRDRVIAGALELADARGLEALTIRALAQHLSVRPMSIYHYVATKDELLDALVDAVFSELYMPVATEDWRSELVIRAESVRTTLVRHPWALVVMETRARPGPASLAAHEAVLELLHAAGFSVEAAGHAYAILDAFIYGFALQDSMLRFVELNTSAEELRGEMDLSQHPRLAAMAAHFVESETYPIDTSFKIGLRLALDGIARLRDGSDESGSA